LEFLIAVGVAVAMVVGVAVGTGLPVAVTVEVEVAGAADGVPILTVGTTGIVLEPSGGTGTEGTALGSNPGVVVAVVGTSIVGATVGTSIVGATVGILLGNAAGIVGAGVAGTTTVGTTTVGTTTVGTTTVGTTTVGTTTVGTTTVTVGSDATTVTVGSGATTVTVGSGRTGGVGRTGTPGIVGNGRAVIVGNGRAVIVGNGRAGALGITLGTTAEIAGKAGAGIRVATTVGADATALSIVVATLPGNAVPVATADAPCLVGGVATRFATGGRTTNRAATRVGRAGTGDGVATPPVD